MTVVILLGGIDLSVGSVMGFSTIVCAMLLTQPGWTPAAIMGVPAAAIVTGLAVGFLARFVFHGLERGRDVDAGRRKEIVLGPWRGVRIPAAARPCRGRRRRRGHGVAGFDEIRRAGGASGDALRRARARSDQRRAHRRRTASALHRDAGDDGQRARPRPPDGRPGQRGHRRLHRDQRHRGFRGFALDGVGHAADAERLFSRRDSHIRGVLRFTTFGRYVYAIGGNPEAAKLSGIKVAQVQLAAYLISGLLAGVAGVLFVAQYRQGKPDAGSGLELDAIAAVVIGGTSLMGGRGGLAGTFVGVLIFGLLSDILQLQNIDSNVQLVMKGLIIVGTVLVQEQNLGQLLARWRSQAPTLARERTGSAETNRPHEAVMASTAREDIHEAS